VVYRHGDGIGNSAGQAWIFMDGWFGDMEEWMEKSGVILL
jgi:hypothetical protein